MKVFRVGERIIDEDGCKGTIQKINSSEEVVKYYGTPMYNVSHDVDYNGRKTSADGWYKADKLMSIEKFIPTIEDTTEMKPFSIGYLKNGTIQSIVVMAHNQDDAYLYFAVNEDYDKIYGTTQLYQSTYKEYSRRGMPEITVDYKEINQDKEKLVKVLKDSQTVVKIVKTPNDKYFNYYYDAHDLDHWNSSAGSFETINEAEETAYRHRPNIVEVGLNDIKNKESDIELDEPEL